MAIIAHRAPHLFSLSSRSNRDSGENNLIARSLDLKAVCDTPKIQPAILVVDANCERNKGALECHEI